MFTATEKMALIISASHGGECLNESLKQANFANVVIFTKSSWSSRLIGKSRVDHGRIQNRFNNDITFPNLTD